MEIYYMAVFIMLWGFVRWRECWIEIGEIFAVGTAKSHFQFLLISGFLSKNMLYYWRKIFRFLLFGSNFWPKFLVY